MARFTIDENAPILVELEPKAGLQDVARSIDDLENESAKAIASVMNTIYNTAKSITSTIDSMATKPSQVEVNFGIKLEAETGAIIAKAGGEATFGIKLTWQK
jgi:hypothetical protein